MLSQTQQEEHYSTAQEKIESISPEFVFVKEITPRQEKILNFLNKKEPLSAKKIHKGLKEHISERSLRNDLLELKERGRLKMIGFGPGTLWDLVK